jgi:hypothetical protein
MTLDDLIADKLERADPAARAALLRIPLENIDRWLSNGVLSAPDWFLRWRNLIEEAGRNDAAFQRVLHLLRSDEEEAQRWRDFSPFAGVLTSEERRAFFRQCAYSH